MKTTYYQPGNMTRYEIASNGDGGDACFIWWTKTNGGKVGVAVSVKPGEYCRPGRVLRCVPEDTRREKTLWGEDCRVVAYYINCAMLPTRPENHRDFVEMDLPQWARRVLPENRQRAAQAIKDKL